LETAPLFPTHTGHTFVDVLRARAADMPDQRALGFLENGDHLADTLTFGLLDRRARAWAVALRHTCAPGDRALLLFPPGLDFVTAFFGCLYAGVVVIPAYPPRASRNQDRLQAIVTDAEAKIALTTRALFDRVKDRLDIAEVLASDARHEAAADTWTPPRLTGASVAYLQYTSGSTGQPKGVMVTHANLLVNVEDLDGSSPANAQSVMITWLPVFHDMGLVFGLLVPIYKGYPCYMMDPLAFMRHPLRWLLAITRFKGTHTAAPNFAYDLCVQKIPPEARGALDLSCLKLALNGAEPIRATTLEQFIAAFAPHGLRASALCPGYGLAEATLKVSASRSDEAPFFFRADKAILAEGRMAEARTEATTLVGCGTSAIDTRVRIVQPDTCVPCAPDRIGEIWVGGATVAGGYWHKPDVTAEVFHAYTTEGDGPYLRTGDLGFIRAGHLFVTGRLKDMIIIRGRNYYPQDIEVVVEQAHTMFQPAGCAAFAVEVEGEERLVVAQEIKREYCHALDVEYAADLVAKTVLATHDIQTYAVVLLKPSALPKTSSGKVQRAACRQQFVQDSLAALGKKILTPRTEEELAMLDRETLFAVSPAERRRLLEAWLGEAIGRRTGLSTAAGIPDIVLLDSLQALELQHYLERQSGFSWPMTRFLEGVTLTELAEAGVQQLADTTSAAALEPYDASRAFPLSHNQLALWLLHNLAPASSAYNLTLAARCQGQVDPACLGTACRVLLRRHPALRTAILARHSLPWQQVREDAAPDFTVVDATGWELERLRQVMADDAARPFDLTRDVLLRVRLYYGARAGDALLVTTHHVAADFWSMGLLCEELSALYAAASSGCEADLSAPGQPYAAFVASQERLLAQRGEALLRWWRDYLNDAPERLDLPTDRPRPSGRTFRGDACTFHLEPARAAQVRTLAQRQSTTLYTVLLAVFHILLHRFTGTRDMVIGSPMALRENRDFAQTVGFFVNTVPIRVDCAGLPSFTELVARVRQAVLGAMAHRDYPMPLLVERLQLGRSSDHEPLFQAMFVFHTPYRVPEMSAFALGEEGAAMPLGDLTLTAMHLPQRSSQFDVTLTMAETAQGLSARLEYNTDLFDRQTAERLAEGYGNLLAAVVDNPDQQIGRLPLLSKAEHQRILYDWNDTARPFHECCIHELFEAQVARTPDAVALIADDLAALDASGLTYRELNVRANVLAAQLRAYGVSPEVPVGLLLARSPALVIAILAVWKAGGAYLPLDAEYPRERLAFMLEDAGVQVVLADPALAADWPDLPRPVLALTPAGIMLEPGDALAAAAPSAPPRPMHAAYIMYTSGSTGKPKGVVNTHRGLCNRLTWMMATYPIDARDRVLQKTPFSFDVSIWEMCWPLLQGACLVLAPPGSHRDPHYLADMVESYGITNVHFVPSMLRAFLEDLEPGRCQGIERIFCSGEALPADVRDRCRDMLPAALYNLYGPTEAAIEVSHWSCAESAERHRVPMGRPLPNVRLYVLDHDMQPVPPGVVGELYIGGICLARGYLQRPDLTAEAFVPEPFGQHGDRLYRTGDLCTHLNDGNIVYLMRRDHQVKLRGVRIELEEIEVALLAHPDIDTAVAMVREDRPGDQVLTAYLLGAAARDIDRQELRSMLRRMLPEFMIPAAFVHLTALPLLPSGKIDRLALPAPSQAENALAYTPPRTAVEARVAAVWAEVLGIPRVGRHDNFFASGGNSLLAVKVLSRVREALGDAPAIRALFEYPTVAQFAAQIHAARPLISATPEALGPRRSAGPAVLSFAQQRLWFLSRMEPQSPFYNIPGILHVRGALHVDAFRRACAVLVRRHEVLRTVITDDGYAGVLAPTPPELHVYHPAEHLTNLAERQAWAEALLRSEARRPFDLRHGPLLRTLVVRLAPDEHQVLLNLHHIVADAWSVDVLWDELATLYEACQDVEADPLPALPLQYTDFAAWQRHALEGARAAELASYWRQYLHGVPPLDLPVDLPRPPVQTYHGARLPVVLPGPLARAVEGLSRTHDATPFMTLLAAFMVLLHRYTGQKDFCVGVPVINRPRQEFEPLIGCFLNLLPWRADLSGHPDFATLLARVRHDTLNALAHQELPFEKMLEDMELPRDLSRPPLFQVMFSLHTGSRRVTRLAEVDVTLEAVDTGTAKFELTLELVHSDAGITGWLEYNSDLFREDTARRMLGHYHTLLAAVVRDASCNVGVLPLLPEAERQRLLFDWNRSEGSTPAVSFVQHIERWAAERSDAVALVHAGQMITYGTLNRRANQLAWYLREQGIGPEVPVGVYLRRHPDVLVTMLAILKAGGAYVPLDPHYPARRLAHIAADARLPLLLTQQSLLASAPRSACTAVVCLEDLSAALTDRPTGNPMSAVSLAHPAYIIYTSGSTGQPKGVVVTHGNVDNFFAAMDQRLGPEPGCLLAVTTVSFDISVLELWWTLSRGFQVVLQAERDTLTTVASSPAASTFLDFSLLYFARVDYDQTGSERYTLLLEGARFADTHGFHAVWMPERHFHAFGGLYPNPAVTGAALAAITHNIRIRAGSVVSPLHQTIRIAEEWAMVDNLSGGRVDVSFATGWHPNDFVLAPAKYLQRKQVMFDDIETVRKLWRGDPLSLPNALGEMVDVYMHPRPIQPELPIWLTATGNPETFRAAGAMHANVLTHLLGQTVEDMAQHVRIYRAARAEAGLDPEAGRVTLMLHTFLGENLDEVRAQVRVPFRAYLRSSLDLLKELAPELGMDVQHDRFNAPDLTDLLDLACERYFSTSALFGTVESCLPLVHRLKAIGVNEVACLIDFGLPLQATLASLHQLDALRRAAQADPGEDGRPASLASLMAEHHVTHLQCTPALADILARDEQGARALASLDYLMVGGEAFPPHLAARLQPLVSGKVFNMYGPTETTIWSTVQEVAAPTRAVPIGRPIANTQVYLVNAHGHPVPIGTTGRLLIGGAGVTRGYLGRPDLTAARFVPDPFGGAVGARLYDTGDLARWTADGTLMFEGRTDHQVKLHGFRIELGEIEAALDEYPDIGARVVIAHGEPLADHRLVAYLVAKPGKRLPATDDLRAFLKEKLPEYMVPAVFVSLPALPHTPNGKIDRRALPEPEGSRPRLSTDYVPPQSLQERHIAESWQEELHLDHVGAYDNFFDLGGNSLILMRVHTTLQARLGRQIPLIDLLRYPTVHALAHHLSAGAADRAGMVDTAQTEPGDERVPARQRRVQERRASMRERRAHRRREPHEEGSGH
jgi:natural product biosynthesis luciferase-like monooxygenase protein/amino acid adenylation domain-containing protein